MMLCVLWNYFNFQTFATNLVKPFLSFSPVESTSAYEEKSLSHSFGNRTHMLNYLNCSLTFNNEQGWLFTTTAAVGLDFNQQRKTKNVTILRNLTRNVTFFWEGWFPTPFWVESPLSWKVRLCLTCFRVRKKIKNVLVKLCGLVRWFGFRSINRFLIQLFFSKSWHLPNNCFSRRAALRWFAADIRRVFLETCRHVRGMSRLVDVQVCVRFPTECLLLK